MRPIIHNENKIIISFFSIIYLVAIIIVAIQHFVDISFGGLGFISWVIVLVGSAYFIYHLLSEIFA